MTAQVSFEMDYQNSLMGNNNYIDHQSSPAVVVAQPYEYNKNNYN
jgi:hypothetical protein